MRRTPQEWEDLRTALKKHPAGVTLYPTEHNIYADQYEIIVLRILFSEDFLFVAIKTMELL